MVTTTEERLASDRILFVDDDPNIIEDVRTNCDGAAVLHVVASKGMT